ncbi:50S ribosomal protein L30 [uncultured archaeon]|nr:50S ribosomal protein L30 [uncultured archaeon]
MVIAIVLVRGISGMKPDIKRTLELLKLNTKHHCVLYKEETVTIKGMLNVCKDFVTWGTVSKEVLRTLIEKRGRLPGDKRVPAESVDKVIKLIEAGEKKTGIKSVFRLSPPSKGWKSTKDRFPKGALGPRGDKMDALLRRMI